MDKLDQQIKRAEEYIKLANPETVSPQDFIELFVFLIAIVDALKTDTDKENEKLKKDFEDRIAKFITLCERQLQNMSKSADGVLITARQEMNSISKDLEAKIDAIELKPGEPGADAEVTDEMMDDMVDSMLTKFRSKYVPRFMEEIEKLVADGFKKMPAQQVVRFESGGDIGAPFELPIKAGSSNISVRRDPSGAYVIDTNGSGSSNQVRNEVVSGSGTSFTLAHTPDANGVSLFANGQRLIPTIDYTITGPNITTLSSWSAGLIWADYQY